MTFAGIVVAQMGNVLACRTSKVSVFKTSLRSNKWILIGLASQISVLSILVYVPLMQSLFGTAPLEILDWAYLALIGCIVVFAEEIRKLLARKLTK
jgi:magnesium-transporting ATPase (P-type)